MHNMARAWVSMHQALRAVESVNRFWARSLGLNPEDVVLLLLLAKEEHTPTSLAIAIGRTRQQLGDRVNVEVLMGELAAVVRTLVNRKLEGYFAGLYVPREVSNDPNLEFLREATELKTEMEVLARSPPPESVRKERAREHAEATRCAEDEASREVWRRLWS